MLNQKALFAKALMVEKPWFGQWENPTGSGSLGRTCAGFTLLFEALILELVKVIPVHNVCQLFDVYDNKLWEMLKAYTNKARAH